MFRHTRCTRISERSPFRYIHDPHRTTLLRRPFRRHRGSPNRCIPTGGCGWPSFRNERSGNDASYVRLVLRPCTVHMSDTRNRPSRDRLPSRLLRPCIGHKYSRSMRAPRFLPACRRHMCSRPTCAPRLSPAYRRRRYSRPICAPRPSHARRRRRCSRPTCAPRPVRARRRRRCSRPSDARYLALRHTEHTYTHRTRNEGQFCSVYACCPPPKRRRQPASGRMSIPRGMWQEGAKGSRSWPASCRAAPAARRRSRAGRAARTARRSSP